MIRTNCYFVGNKNSDEIIIIDPGEDCEELVELIESENLKPVGIFLTHGHFDHILAVDELSDKYSIKVFICEDEEELIKDNNLNCSSQFRRTCSVHADELFRDGQIMEIGGMQFKVLHTPGHTSGSCCFYFEEDRVLFTGDTVFYLSVGRTDFPTGSGPTLLRSIQEKLVPLDDDVVIYPGHGEDTTIGFEKINSEYW